jgi:hypothetical protein
MRPVRNKPPLVVNQSIVRLLPCPARSTAPRLVMTCWTCSEHALDVRPAGTLSDPENASPKATPGLRVNKHPTGFLFPVIDVQRASHSKEHGNVVRRGFRCSILVICHVRVSMLPLDQAGYPNQDRGHMMELLRVAPTRWFAAPSLTTTASVGMCKVI